MRQAVTQAKKARRHWSPPYWDFMHNAPVWARRQHGMYGYDHLLYDQVHGLMGGSAAAVMPETKVVQIVEKPKSLCAKVRDFFHRVFHRSKD